jgi:exopolysaccharide biosynthesis protein
MVNGWIPALNDACARTFIGYNSTSQKIVFGVLSSSISAPTIANSGVTYFDMHKILKNTLGCTMALNLDGGSSTRIKYKTSSTGNPIQDQVTTSNVYCQLALTASAGSSCIWTGN